MEQDIERLSEADAEDGHWFPFRGKARIKVKRLGGHRRRALWRQHIGKKAVGKDGLDFEKSAEFQIALGSEALLDSERIAVDARYLADTELARETGGDVVLDGKWSPKVKRAVLGEFVALLKHVVKCADSLDAEADEDEEGKG